VTPRKGYDPQAGIAWVLYEIPDRHISLGWHIPLRGFKITETDATGTRTFLCATTRIEIKADVIRRIIHLKWGIENNGNKDLKDNWHLEHNFHHHSTATWAIVLTLLIVYTLFYAFVFRHLKTYRIYSLTISQVIREMVSSYQFLPHWLPWSRWVMVS